MEFNILKVLLVTEIIKDFFQWMKKHSLEKAKKICILYVNFASPHESETMKMFETFSNQDNGLIKTFHNFDVLFWGGGSCFRRACIFYQFCA